MRAGENHPRWIPRVRPRPTRMKLCRGICGGAQPIIYFDRDRRRADGRRDVCKLCRSIQRSRGR